MLLFLCVQLLLRNLSVFFDYGRAIMCMLPLGRGRFLHFVVLCGYEGADREAEKLALTDQLLDAALGLWVDLEAAWPVLLVGCLV